jgi:hypothetical protein
VKPRDTHSVIPGVEGWLLRLRNFPSVDRVTVGRFSKKVLANRNFGFKPTDQGTIEIKIPGDEGTQRIYVKPKSGIKLTRFIEILQQKVFGLRPALVPQLAGGPAISLPMEQIILSRKEQVSVAEARKKIIEVTQDTFEAIQIILSKAKDDAQGKIIERPNGVLMDHFSEKLSDRKQAIKITQRHYYRIKRVGLIELDEALSKSVSGNAKIFRINPSIEFKVVEKKARRVVRSPRVKPEAPKQVKAKKVEDEDSIKIIVKKIFYADDVLLPKDQCEKNILEAMELLDRLNKAVEIGELLVNNYDSIPVLRKLFE